VPVFSTRWHTTALQPQAKKPHLKPEFNSFILGLEPLKKLHEFEFNYYAIDAAKLKALLIYITYLWSY